MRSGGVIVMAIALATASACTFDESGVGVRYQSARESVAAACDVVCELETNCMPDIDKVEARRACARECLATVCAVPCTAKTCVDDCNLPPAGDDRTIDACLADARDSGECVWYLPDDCRIAVLP